MRKVVYIAFFSFTLFGFSQIKETDWLSFEELETKLSQAPKKILVYFYADWCVYCKKMDKAVYGKPEIQALLKEKFYPVKFNAESRDSIFFGGKTFINAQYGNQRNPVHQIPEFLAGRPDKELELPATVILDKDFNIERRFYRYIPPKEMLSILKE